MGSTISPPPPNSPNSNPNQTQPSTPKPTTEASSSPPQPPKLSETQFDSSKTQIESSKSEALEPQNSTEPVSDQTLGERDGEEEEEEGECGFCLFMKGGGCRESFVAWEKCIEEAEEKKEDIVDKCFEVTGALKKCMEVHSEYYAPILQAEKAAEAEAVRELEKEKEKERENGRRKEVPEPEFLRKD